MIEIEVIECPDPDYLGVWTFQKNQVYFGHPEGDVIPQNITLSNALMVEILPGFLQTHPHPKLDFWLLNGKRATRPKKIKVGDTLKVQDTVFKIKAAEYHETLTKKQTLDPKLKALINDQHPILDLIQLLNPKTK